MDLSMIVPTYNEKDNLPLLLKGIDESFKKSKIKGEVIIVDDGSPDGTGELADALKKEYKFLKVVHRKGKLGLSSAVLEGFEKATSNILGVMDADLSHPTEKISEMYFVVNHPEVDLVIGSRYMLGGSIEGWGGFRTLQSKGAVFIAKLFTKVRDPVSGFFMVKKRCLKGKQFNPKGFKILLELIVKAKCENIKEVPFHFVNRKKGKTKAGFGEIFKYLENVLGYLKDKYFPKKDISKEKENKSSKTNKNIVKKKDEFKEN
ncbi:hypothetical protein COU54_00725 [Candidatus Pacearchaeota archaeon CG10_big_fil_rev_8_21_14_0_10_31_24]|nr:MAG: hypothetical protein COU54_00725 [Candidatus Pacearchaeota archaeon CG10_big_fil_rev_8_21_14_0_10_31_24]